MFNSYVKLPEGNKDQHWMIITLRLKKESNGGLPHVQTNPMFFSRLQTNPFIYLSSSMAQNGQSQHFISFLDRFRINKTPFLTWGCIQVSKLYIYICIWMYDVYIYILWYISGISPAKCINRNHQAIQWPGALSTARPG